MREMEYVPYNASTILYKAKYKGFNYFIISYGTHPCAYVEIPINHPYYGKGYDEITDQSYVHGGFTYSANGLLLLDNTWILGWDYAHCGDYYCYSDNIMNIHSSYEDKRWTTEEIDKECKHVIDQLDNIGCRYPYNGIGGLTHE